MYETYIRGSHPLGFSDERCRCLLAATVLGQSIIIFHIVDNTSAYYRDNRATLILETTRSDQIYATVMYS
jgi:hypothetical protein